MQRQKEKRVLRIEDLYQKEKDLAVATLQVRAVVRKRDIDRAIAKRAYLGERKPGSMSMVDPSGRERRF